MKPRTRSSARFVALALCAASLLLVLLAAASCAGAARKLAPNEKEFLDRVSLIMTRQERKAFLSLPPEDRGAFMDDFWKRRDPDPATEANEFKTTYFQRLTEANKLFREGGNNSGYRSERGRIYVLLGPPERRDVYPMGYTFYEPPVEIWWYGFFRLLFIDRYHLGQYQLDPGSAMQLNQINFAQMYMNQEWLPMASDDARFAITLQVGEGKEGQTDFNVLIPVKSISFEKEAASEVNHTVIRVGIEIWSSDRSRKISERKKDFDLRIRPEELEKLPKYVVLTLSQKLEPGEYLATVTAENSSDKSVARRETSFRR